MPAVDKVKKGIAGIEQNYDTMHKEQIISAFQPMKWGWGIIMQRPSEEVFHHSGEAALGLFLLAAAFLILGGITAYKGAGLLFAYHRLSSELQKKEMHEREMKEMLMTELDDHLRTGQKLAETMAELERSNKELEQFAYVASHDLQEPLRKITNFIDLLEKRYKDRFDQEAVSYLHYIVDGAKRMQTLINDLLAYCRIGTRGKPFLQTDLNKVLIRVLVDLDKAIKSCGAEVKYDPLPTLRADELQIGQVFQNLIGNAVKFCRDAPPRIHIGAVHEGEGWVFSVSDNGIGIKRDFFDRIFVMFQRLHTETEYPGTGIGLAVCKKIVERHGGNIWVESEVGKGATFYFRIPEKQQGE
jgi:light-regulated signal transduction histidine kinase (bacteriophytochrome)